MEISKWCKSGLSFFREMCKLLTSGTGILGVPWASLSIFILFPHVISQMWWLQGNWTSYTSTLVSQGMGAKRKRQEKVCSFYYDLALKVLPHSFHCSPRTSPIQEEGTQTPPWLEECPHHSVRTVCRRETLLHLFLEETSVTNTFLKTFFMIIKLMFIVINYMGKKLRK